jgi:beta-lactamase regulating signal transducer with metallopeptidase domain
MNAWGTAIMWGMLQVTLLAAFGVVLYAVARRRGPAAGALASVGTLLTVLAITVLAVAPLPSNWSAANVWRVLEQATRKQAPAMEQPEAAARVAAESPALESAIVSSKSSSTVVDFWSALVDEMRRAPVEQAAAPRRWPWIVLLVFATGAVWGLVRLLAGATAVRSYRRQSRPIADAALVRLLESLGPETGCRRRVEVRESTRLSTPATVGCFRPLVLLPDGWRGWSPQELRAVLAHELAHVARGDFLAGLVAQVTLAVHFYHPLVHWLVGRLRLEQELAADASGMRASGGRDVYLVTLAGMALRQDDLAVSWAARPFLPTRGTLMRRIEMLRDARTTPSASLPRGGRALLIGVLALAGLLVAGLRPDERELRAQAPAKDPTQPTLFNLKAVESQVVFLPDAKIIASVRPAAILAQPELAPLAKSLNELLAGEYGLSVEQLEQVTFSLLDPVKNQTCLQLTSSAPHDWKTLIAALSKQHTAKEVVFGRRKFLRLENHPAGMCIAILDERSILILPEKSVKDYILASDEDERLRKAGKSPAPRKWSGLYEKVAQEHATVIVDPAFIRAAMKNSPDKAQSILAGFAPLWDDTEAAVLGVGLEEGLTINGYAETTTAEGAERVARTLEAVKALFLNMAPTLRRQAAEQSDEIANLNLKALDAALAIANSAKLTTSGNFVELKAEGPGDTAVTLGVLMPPALASAREAARRSQSMNNLKQIGLAMHNYHDARKSFPPAVVIGPDGKTPHSWRVAILPYLGQDALYNQYKLDEPWDSENNRKVLAQMPAVYRDPSDDRAEPYSSYFVLTGDSTVFPGSVGSKIADLLDGTSNTLLAVEAKRDIPWTKPEDIAYDPDAPLPKLGGFHPGGFNAARCDGSVRFHAESIDEATLRALATRAGSEVVPQ